MAHQVYAQAAMSAVPVEARTDEDLMRDLARGRQDALGPLYGRYAALVFHLAVQSVDRPAAEELVQEVFLTIWRGAANFDAAQGPFRPWLLRLTHWKILNELRRQRRRPSVERDDSEDEPLHQVVDLEPGPEEQAWQNEHEHLVLSALESLPPKQRQAIAMAFLQDMTHEQVARALDVPLGTAKTRIRSGLQILRVQLAPMVASLLGVSLAVLGFRYVQTQVALDREQRAVALVATSELTPLRLVPVAADVPATAHARYFGRPGNNVAVLTTEQLPPAPAGRTYEAWARHGSDWTSLGTFSVDDAGTARLVAEDHALSTPPDAVEITLEPSAASRSPQGLVILAWATP